MSFDYNENLTLSNILMSKKDPSGKFSYKNESVSYDSLNTVFSNNLKEIVGTPKLYRQNKDILFSLLEETIDNVLPRKVLETYGMFADIQTVSQGDTVYFTRVTGKTRGKQFITRVAMAGRYEVFELGEEKFPIKTNAYGGAARIGIEEFLDGRVQWSDLMDIINEGLQESVYKEIAKGLSAAVTSFPATNQVFDSTLPFLETLDRLIATVSAYGSPVIYCTAEAAMQILPGNNMWSDNMLDEYWGRGYFAKYKGVPIIILPQSFTDETNTVKVIDPSYVYIFPSNGTKPVKIVFEGQSQVKEFSNRDWSTEIQTYTKFGVGVMGSSELAVYRNGSFTIDNVPFTP